MCNPKNEDRRPKTRLGNLSWVAAQLGLALVIFSIVALSSAGRIDVIDAQTRYEVGRSLVEHGDSIVRNDDVWFAVFKGRNGERYSNYRFPHSLVAAAAILLSDGTGPVREVRRQFFFSLSGAVLCGIIAVIYAGWFRRNGHGNCASIAWAAGGILCTPIWFYGTTAYDDVLGTLVGLAAVLAAFSLSEHERKLKAEGRRQQPAFAFCLLPSALVSGLLLGLAFNCKPPLVLFLPAVVAALWKPEQAAKERWLQARIVFFCAAIGVIAYEAYDLWKFPPSTWPGVAEARGEYVALWPGSPLAGLLSLLVSPGMGALWYWPAIAIALCGLVAWCRINSTSPKPQASNPTIVEGLEARGWGLGNEARRSGSQLCKGFALITGLSCIGFLCFISSIRFFSGEPAWGPRYLTPVFGVLWLFVPAGAVRLRWTKTAALLAASFAVQVAGLTVEPMRFFTGDDLGAAEGFLKNPWTYFRFDRSQLLARPRQVWEIVSYDGSPAPDFTPAKLPTLPLIIYVKTDKRMQARDYGVLSRLRPWWLTFQSLPADERPVDLHRAADFLLMFGGGGLAILGIIGVMSLRPARRGVAKQSPRVDAEWRDDAAVAV